MRSQNKMLLDYLKQGKSLTARQADVWFGISRMSARVYDLRQEGHAVYAERKTTSRGENTMFYRLGKPSRDIVAAGYRSLSAATAFRK